MIEGLLGSVAGIVLLIVIVFLVLHLLNSLIKAAVVIVALLAIAYFVFGWSFGLGGIYELATRHTDVSEEGLTFKLDPTTGLDEAVVARIIDGDTVELEDGSKVRLLGINAPETGQTCSLDAKQKLQELVLNKTVSLESGEEDVDTYGRLLRYIWLDDVSVNQELVKLGLAHVYKYGEELKYEQLLYDAQSDAVESEGCLWVASEHKDCFSISEFQFDASGDDNDNLNEEFVVIKNSCENEIDMTSWTVKDESASNMYTFSAFTFSADSEFTLFSGKGVDSATELYWGRTQAVWNNDADTLFLRDTDGNLALAESYVGE